MSDKAEEHVQTAAWWALSLKYGAGALAVVFAVRTIETVASQIFALLIGNAGTLGSYGPVDVVTESILAVLFSLIAFLLYRKVSKDIAAAPDYVYQPLYHFITNVLVGALVLEALYGVAVVVSVLLNSLFLIGAGADYGALYLGQFLPALITTATAVVAALFAFNIMKGKNRSLPMTITVLAVAGALFLMTAITVPIKAHSSTASTYNTSTTNIDNYLNSLYKN